MTQKGHTSQSDNYICRPRGTLWPLRLGDQDIHMTPRVQATWVGGWRRCLPNGLSSWSGLAPAPCSPGSSCSCLSLVRATSSWWVQSLVATMPSRPTLLARGPELAGDSSEHLWRPGYQGRAKLNTRESGAWPTCGPRVAHVSGHGPGLGTG